MLTDLFKPRGAIACFAGDSRLLQQDNLNQWDAWKGHGFLNCRIPIRRYTTFFPAGDVANSDRALNISEQENVLATGSPHASTIARHYLPYWDERSSTPFSEGSFAAAAAIPFHFVIRKEKGMVISPSVGGPNSEELKSLRVRGKEYDLGNEPGKLIKSDFLLVTRLPKIGGGYIILVAGGHGAGTRSFELVFDRRAFSDEQLRDLYRVIGGKECFQVAFRCYDLEHTAESTITRKIEVWDDLAVEIKSSDLVL